MSNGENSARNEVIYAEVVARVWQDPSFKQQLLANPKQVLTEAGMSLDEATQIQVLENSATVKHLVVDSAQNWEEIKDALINSIAAQLSQSPQTEVVIHQKTEAIVYFILPVAPTGATRLSEEELSAIAGGDVEAVNTNTSVNAEAEANAVAVQNAAAATEVAVAGVAVAFGAVVLI